METNNQDKKPAAAINMKRVEELESVLRRQMTFTSRFRFNMSAEDAATLLTAYYKIEVQSRLRQFKFDTNTQKNLLQLAEYLTAKAPRFGIMLSGTCGNGKTTLMCAFQRALNHLAALKHFSFMDEYFKPRMRIMHACEITDLAHDIAAFTELKRRSMLGIDDLGTEPAEVLEFGNPIYPVVRLIEYRYSTQAFTFITTNLTPSEIRKKYGDRIADRFNEMLHVIVFQDVTYRR